MTVKKTYLKALRFSKIGMICVDTDGTVLYNFR